MSKYELKSTNPKDKVGIEKVPLHLNPTTAAVHQALAHLDGAIKYGPYNWREEGVSASVYVAAMKRHIDKWFESEELAQDSLVHHLGHVMACAAIILDSKECGNLVDDRPKPAPTTLLHDQAAHHVREIVHEVNAKPASPPPTYGRGC